MKKVKRRNLRIGRIEERKEKREGKKGREEEKGRREEKKGREEGKGRREEKKGREESGDEAG